MEEGISGLKYAAQMSRAAVRVREQPVGDITESINVTYPRVSAQIWKRVSVTSPVVKLLKV